jgi:Zn-dependent peptidase ImmA (M78 family)/transcriptional regulator with XRE-family HTH domain
MGWVHPGVLRQLREQAGLTIQQTAWQSRGLRGYAPIEQEALEQWEMGSGQPDLEHLESLSEIYHCPVGHFFLDQMPQPGVPIAFRGLSPGKEQSFGANTRASLRRFVALAEWFTDLLESSGIDWKVSLAPLHRHEHDLEGLCIAKLRELGFDSSVRATWEDPEDAFWWWRSRIEHQGVFCFQLPLDPSDARAACLWMKGRYPFLLVNHQDAEAASGRLFSLLHEYGHLLLHGRRGVACDFAGRSGGRHQETLANRFAARILLPPAELRQYLEKCGQSEPKQTWADKHLSTLAKQFAVSRHVVAITLEQIGLAPTGFYQRKRDQWEKKFSGWKPWGRGRNLKKWERKARELGTSALRVLVTLDRRGKMPAIDTAYVLETKVEKTPELLRYFSAYLASIGRGHEPD